MSMISIITINLNNKNGLTKTFESVFSQTYRGIEHILIDGNSTDGSIDVIKRFSSNVSYWVSEPDQGIYHAMNKGIKVASGDYLVFLNSGDTFYRQNVLEKVTNHLNNEDLVYGDICVVGEKGSRIKSYPSKLSFKYFFNDTLPHPASFIKRDLFQKVGLYNESNKIVSDWEFFTIAINKYTCSYKYIPITISNFLFDGISSREEFQEIRKMEINNALQRHFPTFLPDYEELAKVKEEMQSLSHSYNLLVNSRLHKYAQKVKNFLSY